MTTATVTPQALADEIVRLCRIDFAAEPERYGKVTSWEELHDVCDANEFLIEAEENLSVGMDYGDPAFHTLANDAVEIAQAALWPPLTEWYATVTGYGHTSTFRLMAATEAEAVAKAYAERGITCEVSPR